MVESEKLKVLKKFIYNSDVHKILSAINNGVMDYNILEIAGMGTQEIKHSNVLSWMFGDNEHNQGYKILLDFLLLVIEENDNSDLLKEIEILKEYIFLSTKEKNLQIYREKDNIDILIVDDVNKFVIAIENKVYSDERVKGDDGGQLLTYEEKLSNNFSKEYKKYFIYLTIYLDEPSRENWLKADYEMIVKSIQNILDSKSVTEKTKIVLSSYIDLLKRRGIVEDKNVRELCEKIWMNKEYKDALEILIANKTTQVELIRNKIIELLEKEELEILGECIGYKSIKELYKYYSKKWEEATDKKDFLLEITLSNEKNKIWFGYECPNFEEQDENLVNLYKKIIGKEKLQKKQKIDILHEYDLDTNINIEEKAQEFASIVVDLNQQLSTYISEYINIKS